MQALFILPLLMSALAIAISLLAGVGPVAIIRWTWPCSPPCKPSSPRTPATEQRRTAGLQQSAFSLEDLVEKRNRRRAGSRETLFSSAGRTTTPRDRRQRLPDRFGRVHGLQMGERDGAGYSYFGRSRMLPVAISGSQGALPRPG